MEAHVAADGSFGQIHFGAAAFGDKRVTKRLIHSANRMAQHPYGSLPDKMQDPAALKGLYRLMNNPKVNHHRVLQPHYRQTMDRMCAHHGVLLLVQDGTELDYTGLESLKDELGQIGSGHHRGYICQNTLAVVPGTRQVLGLANQLLHRRDVAPPDETAAQRRSRESRESRIWKHTSQAITRRVQQWYGGQPAGTCWVEVCDRGADIFEYLDYKDAQQQPYLVRSKSNRRVVLQPEGEPAQQCKLHDYVRSLPAQGQRDLEVPAGPGRPARTARVAVAWGRVNLLPPRNRRGEDRRKPIEVWVVRVWELDPPAGVEGLEWILLTNVAVTSRDQAWERVDWYSDRWVIEEYHKAKKTGCAIEEPQFTRVEALQATIALISVVSLLLLGLRDASRRPDARTRPAREVLPAEYVEVLSAWRLGNPSADWSVWDFYYALARLGGHQNRRHDGLPGWIVLWRGWTKLQAMLEGARVIRGLRSG